MLQGGKIVGVFCAGRAGSWNWVLWETGHKNPNGNHRITEGFGVRKISNHHPVPPLLPEQGGPTWKNSRDGATKTSMCRSWMSRGILGTATFQPGCGSQSRDRSGSQQEPSSRESVTALEFPGCSWSCTQGVSGCECCRKVPSLPAQLWDAGSSPQLCVPAVPWLAWWEQQSFPPHPARNPTNAFGVVIIV